MVALRTLILLAVGMTAGAAPPAAAQDVAVEAEVQYPLFLKVMALDHRLGERVGEELVIGVVFQAQIRESWTVKDAFIQAAETSPVRSVRGVPVRSVPVEWSSAKDMAAIIDKHGIDVLYVGPLRAVGAGEVAALARTQGLSTLTGVPSYVGDGLAVGVGLRGRRPEILINLEAARAEGADFNAQLLRVARVVEG